MTPRRTPAIRAYVGVTDSDWFDLLAAQAHLDEVNFWQPSGNRVFGALTPGELFLFKLHSPRNFIVGGGIFAHATVLPASLAWDSFGLSNGATNLLEMRSRIEKYRRAPVNKFDDYTIGCILLEQPFFFPEGQWIPVPDWKRNIVQGKTYDLKSEPGLTLWAEIGERLERPSSSFVGASEPAIRYGEPSLLRPRLGQGSFRVLVTEAYEKRCAVTQERTLPVLEAAHIKSYSAGGEHRVDTGLLLRSDLHTLFDRGYVTVTNEYRVEVSARLREDFENGRDYYKLAGNQIRLPAQVERRPAAEFLRWHNEQRYRG